MIIHLCIKFQSDTLILSKAIPRKPFVLHIVQTDWTGLMGRTDSGDTICTPHPIENGGGMKNHQMVVIKKGRTIFFVCHTPP